MGSYRTDVADKLKFGIQVYISKMHFCDKFQLTSLDRWLAKIPTVRKQCNYS